MCQIILRRTSVSTYHSLIIFLLLLSLTKEQDRRPSIETEKMRGIAAAFLFVFLQLQLITGIKDDYVQMDANLLSKRNVDPTAPEDINDTFYAQPFSIVDKKLSAISAKISKIRSQDDAGLVELQDITKSLEFVIDVIKKIVPVSRTPTHVKGSIENVLKEMPQVFTALETIGKFMKEMSTSQSFVDKDKMEDANGLSSSLELVPTYDKVEPHRRLNFKNSASSTSSSTNDNENYNYHFRSKNNWNRNRSSFKYFSNFSKKAHTQFRHSKHHSSSSSKNRRRLNENTNDGEEECVDIEDEAYKLEQCERLVHCTSSYKIYDLYVYLYGDDIDFTNGDISSEEEIVIFDDDKVLSEKFKTIMEKTKNTKQALENPNPNVFDQCDDLLQQFYRFNERFGGIHAAETIFGKWQGGTVNSVCRESDTTKNLSLESILMIRRKAKYEQFHIPPQEKAINDYLALFYDKSPCKNLECPEGRTVQMFEDFVLNCAGKLGEVSKETSPSRNPFKGSDSFNPFTFDNVNFSIPLISTMQRDKYGKPKGTKLDTIFDYETLPGKIIDGEFDDELRSFLIKTVASESETLQKFQESYITYIQNKEYSKNYLRWPDDYLVDDKGHDGFKCTPVFKKKDKHYHWYLCWPNNLKEKDPGIETIESSKGKIEGKRCTDYHWIDNLDNYFICVPKRSNLYFARDFRGREVKYFAAAHTLCAYDMDGLEKAVKALFKTEYAYRTTCWDSSLCTDLKDLVEFVSQNHEKNIQKIDQKGSFLDRIIAMVYGDEISVGDVCQYANELSKEDAELKGVRGYCCLDAPYQNTDYWGEKYSCTHDHGPLKGSLKEKGHDGYCNIIAPYTAGFGEPACDVFSGTWCHQPRSCQFLVDGIKKLHYKASRRADRIAFFEYLDIAPTVENIEDPVQCGELRKYLEYDADYPNDETIIENVKNIQCRDDFQNINDYATGKNGPSSGEDDDGDEQELFIDNKLHLVTKAPFDSGGAKAWRSANFVLKKAMESIDFALKLIDVAKEICVNLVSAIPGTASPCTVAYIFAVIPLTVARFVLLLSISISERIYDETVPIQYSDYVHDYRTAIHENVVINHKNIITTFKGVKQLKKQIGDISDIVTNLSNDEDEKENRRALQETCKENDICMQFPNICSCEDDYYLCNCKPNYDHIKTQIYAGCDGQDSDGDKMIDYCEDRYPPNIILSDPASFINYANISTLQYSKTIFSNKTQLENFFKLHASVDDDCQDEKDKTKVYIEIKHEAGKCEDTIYHLTPIQNVTECNIDTNFTNPLYGDTSKIQVNLDEISPVVECGFHDVHPKWKSIPNIVNGKTMFHYGNHELQDSGFFYKVTENCPTEVNIKITLESNQFDSGTIMGQVKNFKTQGYNEQAVVNYDAHSCDQYSGPECLLDGSAELNVRFYEIKVLATDSAGHVGTDTCKIIIVPSCNLGDEGCATSDDVKPHQFYYRRDFLLGAISKSIVRYDIMSTTAVWNKNLRTLRRTITPVSNQLDECHIDDISPVVECGFHNISHDWKTVINGKTLFNYGNDRLQDSGFFYRIVENCPMVVNVKIIVESNQFEYGTTMGQLKTFKRKEYNEQTKLYYRGNSCRHTGPECEQDDSIEVNIRFYEIKVIATDSAGHVGMDTCKIIIVPSCYHGDYGCATSDAAKPHQFYYERNFLLDVVRKSGVRYGIMSTTANWKRDLRTPPAPLPVPKCSKSTKCKSKAHSPKEKVKKSAF